MNIKQDAVLVFHASAVDSFPELKLAGLKASQMHIPLFEKKKHVRP